MNFLFNLYNEYEFFPSNEYKIEGFNKKFSNPNDNLIIKSYERVFLLKNKKIQFLTIKQIPRQSKPGPRFAEVAKVLTIFI